MNWESLDELIWNDSETKQSVDQSCKYLADKSILRLLSVAALVAASSRFWKFGLKVLNSAGSFK